jgi:hypothetical protein
MIISEETRKADMARLYFSKHVYLPGAVKNVDFCVKHAAEDKWVFLAEAKSRETPLARMTAQLILTLRKAAIGEYELPKYLGVFDDSRICFMHIAICKDILRSERIPDIAPSKSGSEEFKEFQKTAAKYLYNPIYNARLFELRQKNKIKDFIELNVLENDII